MLHYVSETHNLIFVEIYENGICCEMAQIVAGSKFILDGYHNVHNYMYKIGICSFIDVIKTKQTKEYYRMIHTHTASWIRSELSEKS